MLLSMEEFRAFQPKKPTYALFGWPLGHTMSPELHAQLFEASGQDAAYIGVAVPPDDLAEAFDLAKAKLRGINCTIPHKKAVIELLDGVDTAARDLHSVNTVAFRDGKAIGYNTDILGFSESLVRDGVTLRGKKVLLLGYGGAVLRPENVAAVKETGLLIHLDTPFYRILKNLSYSNSRPLLNRPDKQAETRRLYNARKAIYHRVSDTSVRSPKLSEVLDKVVKSV